MIVFHRVGRENLRRRVLREAFRKWAQVETDTEDVSPTKQRILVISGGDVIVKGNAKIEDSTTG